MNILIFDNSFEVRSMIQRNLLQINNTLNIVYAGNMLTANELLEKEIFDLVIIDIDSLEGRFPHFVTAARRTNPNIFILLLFSFPSKRVFKKFKDKGADYCLDKNNEFEELLKKIDSLLVENYQLEKVVR